MTGDVSEADPAVLFFNNENRTVRLDYARRIER
jgi:hypothetical protein